MKLPSLRYLKTNSKKEKSYFFLLFYVIFPYVISGYGPIRGFWFEKKSMIILNTLVTNFTEFYLK